MSIVQRLIVRQGLEINIPALAIAEVGYDIDTKTFRIGDNSATPPRIMSTKSTGLFDFSATTSVKYKEILMTDGGKVDGVDISQLATVPGMLIHTGNGNFTNRTFTNNDGYLTVTQGNGVSGNPTINISDQLLELINVTHDGSLFGNGSAAFPLGVVQASTSQLGGAEIATIEEAQLGILNTHIITPATLAGITSGPTINNLHNVVGAVVDGQGLSGRGTLIDPIILTSATETAKGGVELATNNETQIGTDTSRAITPASLSSRTATTDRTGVVELATTAEAVAGTSTTLAITPAGVAAYVDASIPVATTTVQGIVELATSAESQAGTDATRAITPATLTARSATDTRTGLVELATIAEAVNGTDGTRVVTPAGLTAALNAIDLPIASSTQRGIVETATYAETIAGTDTSRYVTPAGLKYYTENVVPVLGRWRDTGTNIGSNNNQNWTGTIPVSAMTYPNIFHLQAQTRGEPAITSGGGAGGGGGSQNSEPLIATVKINGRVLFASASGPIKHDGRFLIYNDTLWRVNGTIIEQQYDDDGDAWNFTTNTVVFTQHGLGQKPTDTYWRIIRPTYIDLLSV